MIQKMFFLIVFLTGFTTCEAQLTDKIIMETYSKKIDTLEVKMFIGTDVKNEKTTWDICIYNNKKDSVLIDHLEYPGIYQEEQEYISGDIRKHVIIGDVILLDKTIYLMLYNYGKTYLNAYEFIESKTFTKKEYFAGSIRTGSYLNYGHPKYVAEIKAITKNDLYIYVSGGTELSSGRLPMIKFKTSTKKICQIIFNENSLIKIKDEKSLFEAMNLNNNKLIVSNEINKIIANDSKGTEYFNYLDFLEISNLKSTGYRNNGVIYFFYKGNSMNQAIDIIRYNIGQNEWLICDFKEEEIGL
jgi:hypothetical protein